MTLAPEFSGAALVPSAQIWAFGFTCGNVLPGLAFDRLGNGVEVEGNGLRYLTVHELRDILSSNSTRGNPSTEVAIYPRRAVLNVAMLLRDSTVRRPGIPRRPGGQCGRFPWWVCGRSDGGVCPGEGGLWRVGGLFRKSLFPRRPAVRPTDI